MESAPRALITGLTGQDGSYLAELLLNKGYEVFGIALPPTAPSEERHLKDLERRTKVSFLDICDQSLTERVVQECKPDEIYHLAAHTFVSYSPDAEQETLLKNISGLQILLAAARKHVPQSRFFFACSSEIFGNPQEEPQTLETKIAPRSVYGISKVTGMNLVRYYRTQHKYFAVSGILYNHESPRRGSQFVTQKIATAAAKIKMGLQSELILGNLDSRRDWGHAEDFVEGFWKQLQSDSPVDLIFSTGVTHTVREFADRAFSNVGLDYRQFVRISEEFFRPTETIALAGDPNLTFQTLGWKANRSFYDIVDEMVDAALKRLAKNPSL